MRLHDRPSPARTPIYLGQVPTRYDLSGCSIGHVVEGEDGGRVPDLLNPRIEQLVTRDRNLAADLLQMARCRIEAVQATLQSRIKIHDIRSVDLKIPGGIAFATSIEGGTLHGNDRGGGVLAPSPLRTHASCACYKKRQPHGEA